MKAAPYAILGFVIGAAIGFSWGRTAKSRIGDSIKAEVDGAVIRVEFDAGAAARSGFPDVFLGL